MARVHVLVGEKMWCCQIENKDLYYDATSSNILAIVECYYYDQKVPILGVNLPTIYLVKTIYIVIILE